MREDEVDSFTNIKSLEDTTDKNDIFHIAKMNCCKVSGTPSYVFVVFCLKRTKLGIKF